MKPIVYIVIMFLLPIACLSQKKAKAKPRYHSLSITVGSMACNSSFYNSTNSLRNFDLKTPVYTIGVQIPNIHMLIGRGSYYALLSYSQIVPVQIKINDSVSSRLSGFSFLFGLYTHQFFKKSEVVNLKAGLAGNVGLVRLRSSTFDKIDPLIAPSFYVYNGYTLFKRLILGVTVSYSYDISGSGWKSILSTRGMDIHKFDQSGLHVLFGLGWVW